MTTTPATCSTTSSWPIPDSMIRPHPRYHELYMMRSSWNSSAKQALDRFRPRDLRDLQVWSNLAWVHPLLFEKDPELAEFKEKGRYYTEDEKQWFLDKQRELLARGDPAASRAGRAGPDRADHHALLPPHSAAACSTRRSAREAMPDVALAGLSRRLPRGRRRRTSAARSKATLATLANDRGACGPSEGSVSPGVDPAAGRARHRVDRDRRGDPGLLDGRQDRSRQPGSRPPSRAALSGLEGPRGRARAGDRLPRPFDVGPDRVSLSAKSRPGRGRRLPGQAARPSATPAATIRRRSSRSSSTARTAGSITRTAACRSSARFTRGLLATRGSARSRSASSSASIRRPTPCHRLFAGSWISHNFAIWIGHPEDNRGWDALHAAREFLVEEERAGRHDPATLARAWNEIYIAQGSDWFWWYGDDHSSALDGLFDHLFRKHLRNVYTLWAATRPAACSPRSRERAAIGRSTTSRSASRTSRSTAAPPISSGSTRRATSAATTAGR